MTSNNSLPAELLGRSICQLTIVDRLRCERVSPHWNRTIWELGWSDVRKLDRDVVLEGATLIQIVRFSAENLISLIERVGPSLVELDLASFGPYFLDQYVSKVADESLQNCPKLEKLNIRGFNLADFVAFLPSTLRLLEFSGQNINIQTLETLSRRCPNLEVVPYGRFSGINVDIVGGLIDSFPRQKKLELKLDQLFWLHQPNPNPGFLASIGRLNGLEQLRISGRFIGLDGVSLEAIAEGCKKLRLLQLDIHEVPERSLFQLAKMPNLTVLDVTGGVEFSDRVLKKITQRGKLKKLRFSGPITDDSIVYLVERCKSLVSLGLPRRPQITERSLEAIVAEVRRRHGWPPRALPTGPLDPGIFYIDLGCSGIWERAKLDHNPWLRITCGVDRREII